MAKIIPVQFRRSRLPRRLLKDGWWLEAPPARGAVVEFPKRNDAPGSGALPNRSFCYIATATTEK